MQANHGRMRMAGSILAGGILGAGLALLFAPQSGKRTRRDLRHFGKMVLNKSEAIGMDLRNSVEHVMDGLADKVHDGLAGSREWTGKAGRGVQSAMASGKSYLQEGIQKLRRVS